MLRSKHIAVMMLAVGLSGCGGYAMYETGATASFNGSGGSPEWRNTAAAPEPAAPDASASQAPQTTATTDPSASRAKTANTSLFARASEAKVEAKPLDPIGALVNSTQDTPTNSTSKNSASANSAPPNTVLASATPASAAPKLAEPPAAIEKVVVEPHGRAYLFRGIAGLIYSRGMDRLADRINRAGIKATVNTYLVWRVICDEAIRDYRRDPQPITIIGHSAGGDSAMAFAEVLNAADIPVSLLVTYDPTRIADSVAPNVERYINIFQSRNMLGGGDVVQGRGFHGNYASYNLSWHSEIIHINIEKAEHLQEQLVSKIAELSATPPSGEGEAVPVRFSVPGDAPIELWDSGVAVSAHAGDTLQTMAASYHVPVWALDQINKMKIHTPLTEGQRVIVPRHLVALPSAATSAITSYAPTR
jgi:hypothetical protein